MADLATTVNALYSLIDAPSMFSSPSPNKHKSLSSSQQKPGSSSLKKSCISEFHYTLSPMEVSFQALSSEVEREVSEEKSSMELVKNVDASQEKVLEKANRLLEMETTYRTMTEKSSFMLKSPEKKNKQEEAVKRLYSEHEKAKGRIEALREDNRVREDAELKFHPEISEKSRNLLAGRKKPLYLRTEEVMKQKKDEIERLKRMRVLEEQNKEKDMTFKPEILNKTVEKRDIYKDFTEWKRRKDEKLERMNIEIIRKEVEQLTFKPNVNDFSKKLAERKKKREFLAEKSMNLEEGKERTKKEYKIQGKSKENKENLDQKRTFKETKGNFKWKTRTLKEKQKNISEKTITLKERSIVSRERSKESKHSIEKSTEIKEKKNYSLEKSNKKKEKEETQFKHSNENIENVDKRRISKENNNNKSFEKTKELTKKNIKSVGKPNNEKQQKHSENSPKKQNQLRNNPTITTKPYNKNKVNVVAYEPEMDFLLTLLRK